MRQTGTKRSRHGYELQHPRQIGPFGVRTVFRVAI
jgi:hypothetical protein